MHLGNCYGDYESRDRSASRFSDNDNSYTLAQPKERRIKLATTRRECHKLIEEHKPEVAATERDSGEGGIDGDGDLAETQLGG